MTTLGDDAGTRAVSAPLAIAATDEPAAPTKRSVTTRLTRIPPASPSPPSAAITAEIPAVGSSWHEPGRTPGYRRRTPRVPAPLLVRLAVAGLAILVPFAAVGLAVEKLDPSWFASLRNGARPARVAAPVRNVALSSGGIHLTTGGSAPVYTVPAASYSFVVSVASPCWTQIRSPAGASSLYVAETILAKDSPKVVSVKGSSSIEFFATPAKLEIRVGKKTVGTVAAPKAGVLYTFRPATS